MHSNDIHSPTMVNYLETHSTSEPPLLRQLREKTEADIAQSHMLSGYHQGRLLSLLSKMIQPKYILELGTYTGYATLCLAEGLRPDGKMVTLDRNPEVQSLAQEYFNQSVYAQQIEAVLANAKEYLQHHPMPWDLVFLDADKRNYVNYVDMLIPQMPAGGMILADNVLWKSKVLNAIDPKDKMTLALHEFNQKIAQDDRVEVVMLPIRDGVSLIRKK